jgi:hypothetical protein
VTTRERDYYGRRDILICTTLDKPSTQHLSLHPRYGTRDRLSDVAHFSFVFLTFCLEKRIEKETISAIFRERYRELIGSRLKQTLGKNISKPFAS